MPNLKRVAGLENKETSKTKKNKNDTKTNQKNKLNSNKTSDRKLSFE